MLVQVFEEIEEHKAVTMPVFAAAVESWWGMRLVRSASISDRG
jgi:hypothetical protein